MVFFWERVNSRLGFCRGGVSSEDIFVLAFIFWPDGDWPGFDDDDSEYSTLIPLIAEEMFKQYPALKTVVLSAEFEVIPAETDQAQKLFEAWIDENKASYDDWLSFVSINDRLNA
ncbi:hypothetical protein COT97_03720 [Candidatus Falkowbacteria bacterium CG10_big_fil_rev_8_21_14_0_10_39_11]|uniref:Uncharacterized protein n=1 Tax=Candidatus Falkowbacteria bacterium CG10_big_fil_rev_8_21_14_0_10_39_11 TaxID=1974565 RepID=A0A2H0V4I8_9BACT|nr:MAG: hypothetical protein COT97_03720 [Candidatus Falkowbacteria bacterium CG10_big_fil_rev_8_21_14_0_10_39_11]